MLDMSILIYHSADLIPVHRLKWHLEHVDCIKRTPQTIHLFLTLLCSRHVSIPVQMLYGRIHIFHIKCHLIGTIRIQNHKIGQLIIPVLQMRKLLLSAIRIAKNKCLESFLTNFAGIISHQYLRMQDKTIRTPTCSIAIPLKMLTNNRILHQHIQSDR